MHAGTRNHDRDGAEVGTLSNDFDVAAPTPAGAEAGPDVAGVDPADVDLDVVVVDSGAAVPRAVLSLSRTAASTRGSGARDGSNSKRTYCLVSGLRCVGKIT